MLDLDYVIPTNSEYAVPNKVLPFVGEIRDLDAHDWTPVNHWVETFGSEVAEFAQATLRSDWPYNQVKDHDDAEINATNVWNLKRLFAPGAFDMQRRISVMNFTGVNSQFLYPGGMGLFAMIFYVNANGQHKILPSIGGDRRAYGRQVINAYNDWCARTARTHPRIRPVAILLGDTPEDMTSNCRELVKKGVRGVWMPTATPPAGVSPANPLLDPIWDMLSEAGIPLASHAGADFGFLGSDEWRRAPAFEGFMIGEEFSLDPWTLVSFHRGSETFVQTLVLGGVFDRFPRFRYSISEVGAGWLGPCADMMDSWILNSGIFKAEKHAVKLKHLPSDYVRSNIRISPFDFEDVGSYIRRFGLEDCYCYASDYPHNEGGKNPMAKFCRSFEKSGFSQDHLRSFFVSNGKLILPD